MLNRIVAVQECDPLELRSQISNKLRLFLTCALGNPDNYRERHNCSMMKRKMNGASQQKLNRKVEADNKIKVTNYKLSNTFAPFR